MTAAKMRPSWRLNERNKREREYYARTNSSFEMHLRRNTDFDFMVHSWDRKQKTLSL